MVTDVSCWLPKKTRMLISRSLNMLLTNKTRRSRRCQKSQIKFSAIVKTHVSSALYPAKGWLFSLLFIWCCILYSIGTYKLYFFSKVDIRRRCRQIYRGRKMGFVTFLLTNLRLSVLETIFLWYGTGCSLNIVFFQEFSKVCHLSLASIMLLLVVQKITSQKDYCTLALRWELWRSYYSDVGEGGFAVNCEKHIFPEHPVLEMK